MYCMVCNELMDQADEDVVGCVCGEMMHGHCYETHLIECNELNELLGVDDELGGDPYGA